MSRKLVSFDWAIKRILRSKANCYVSLTGLDVNAIDERRQKGENNE